MEVGGLASQGTSAFTLANARTVKVSFGVPDVELSKLNKGQLLTFTTEVLRGREFIGTITDIAPAADAGSRVFNVEVSIPNVDRALKIGMVVALTVRQSGQVKPTALTIPLSAVVQSSAQADKYAVFVVKNRDGKQYAQEQPVELGESNGNLISVVSGISSDATVVTNGSTRLVNGQQIVPGLDEGNIGTATRDGTIR